MKCGGGIKGKKTVINWSLPDFQMFPGDKIESPRFTSALLGGAWHLEIEVNRGEEWNIAISLHRYDEGEGPKTVFVDFYIDVYNKHVLLHKTSRKTIQYEDCSTHCNQSNNFAVNLNLPTNVLLDINMLCQLRPSQIKLDPDPIHLKIDKHLSNDVGNLLYSNLYRDVVLRVGDLDVECHKAILYARIPKMLENIEEGNSTESKPRIIVKKFSPDAINELLLYAYGAGTAETKNLAEFQSIASAYGNERLKKQLSWRDNLNARTIFDCENRSEIFKLPKSFISDTDDTRSTTLIVGDEQGVLMCNVNCEVRSDENGVDHLYFKSELSPFDPYTHYTISCQINLVFNNSDNLLFICGFEHKTGTHPANETVKTLPTSYLLDNMSNAVSDEYSIFFQVKIQIWKGVSEHKISSKRSKPINLFECEECNHLSSDLKALYESQKYSDVTFLSVNGTKFPAHRAIVAARSKELKAIMEKEKAASCIKVPGFSAVILQRKLLWIYTGLQEPK